MLFKTIFVGWQTFKSNVLFLEKIESHFVNAALFLASIQDAHKCLELRTKLKRWLPIIAKIPKCCKELWVAFKACQRLNFSLSPERAHTVAASETVQAEDLSLIVSCSNILHIDTVKYQNAIFFAFFL